MDRRTVFFVVSLSLTLLLVNFFFDYINQDSRREQHEKIKAQKIEQRQELLQAIEENTAKAEDLPLTEIFSDSTETTFLTTGVLLDNSLLTLPWEKNLPKTVYADGKPFHLTYSANPGEGLALFQQSPEDPLLIGDLAILGNFELQLVAPFAKNREKSPLITLANFTDGHFSIPLSQVKKIDRELDLESVDQQRKLPGDSLVLLKYTRGFLPVGVYLEKTAAFLPLEQLSAIKTAKMQEIFHDSSLPSSQKESFYVLENSYQQLVFSSKGGALVEINLPFQSENDKNSVIKEIAFDRQIEQKHPYNATFPLHPYYTPGQYPQGPFNEHAQGQLGGYYPLIRRDLLRKGGGIDILPEFYSLNIVSAYPEMAELVYRVVHFDQHSIVFEAEQQLRRITKTFTLGGDGNNAPYTFDLTIKVEGDSKGLWLTSGIPEVEIISNAPAPALKYRITRNGTPEVRNIKLPNATESISDIYPDWVCNSNGFLGLILDPLTTIGAGLKAQYVPGTLAPSRLVMVDAEYGRFQAQNLPGYALLLPLNPKGGTMKFRIFAGPFASNTLKQVDALYSVSDTGYNPDYLASQSFHGWFSFISAPFSKFLLILMNFFHLLTGSWALSIILLTVALRLMLYPLNAWSTKSMIKMQQIAPEVQRIQEKYKKEPQKAQMQIMNLYREAGVNPLSGCLPILIQMPFLIGMFDLLKSTFELRGASFIPGWIDDLAAPDVLFSWSTPIFFIGTEFHLLPFLLGGVMFMQQRFMSPAPKDPTQMTDQQRQQRAMGTIMTVVFTIMFYHFPSGLNIYWLSSMLLGMLQQWWTQKRMQNKPLITTLAEAKDSTKKRKK